METAYKTNVLNQYERSLLDAVEQTLARSAKAEKTTEPDTEHSPGLGIGILILIKYPTARYGIGIIANIIWIKSILIA